MSDQTITQPEEVSDYYGLPCARWGQCVTGPGEELDPVPAVYVSGHGGGEVDLHDLRLSLDDAERYAARILNAVAWQRARNAEQRAAELNNAARGPAATHDWHETPGGQTVCRQCRTVAYGGIELLTLGAVPACGTPCCSISSWHEISASLRSEPGASKCLFCRTVYTAIADVEAVSS